MSLLLTQLGGAPAITGTAAFTESGEALAAQGSLTFVSTAGFTESGEAIAGVAEQIFASTAALTESGEAIAAVGSEVFASTAALTESGEGISAEASQVFSSEASLIESGESLEAIGNVAVEITGTAAFTESGEGIEATAEVSSVPVPELEPVQWMVVGGVQGGKLGKAHFSSASFKESGEQIAARGMVIMPEVKGTKEIEDFLDEEEILTLFAMME